MEQQSNFRIVWPNGFSRWIRKEQRESPSSNPFEDMQKHYKFIIDLKNYMDHPYLIFQNEYDVVLFLARFG